uniref:Meiosis-specific, MEI4 homolog (S. cerevisiae) n=1 Tax=Seriola lalandi dorsalis TaxID=1841481 RepID=A0A3B4YZ80_SERLL
SPAPSPSSPAAVLSLCLTTPPFAVAVAIIKNTPVGMSGRENAESLACKLRSQDESWKRKAQGLQEEVLRLRQEMLIGRVTSDTKSHDGAVEEVSQDLFGPGCDSETPELLQLDPQPAASVPQHHGTPQETVLHPHVQFLQSLCALHRVEGNSRGLESLWFSPDEDTGSVLTDSVCQLLDSVVAACRDPPPLGPRDLVLQACQVAARAMDLFCSQRLPSAEFVRRVGESLRELTGMLLHHSNQPSRVSNGVHRDGMFACLTLQGQEDSGLDTFPVDQYQNSCYLFWIVEELLQKSKVPCRVEVESEQTGFLSHLEQRVFLLSDEFPLFSIYMWRIGGLLTCSDR